MNRVATGSLAETRSYYPQLDALRAFSVLLVIVYHCFPNSYVVSTWGRVGEHAVRLFFVLSGFLITQILLRGKEAIEEHAQPVTRTLRQFYLRRFLRLSPLYFLTLGVALLCGVQGYKETMPWNFFYLTNVYIAIHKLWPWAYTPLWSLSVEEQFYLFWPLLVLLVPRRYMTKAIVATIVLAPVYRAIALGCGVSKFPRMMMPLDNLDSFGFGALLAWFMRPDGGEVAKRALHRLCTWALYLGLPLYLISKFFPWDEMPEPLFWVGEHIHYGVWGPVTRAFFFVWLVHFAARGTQGFWGRLLENKMLIGIGQRSYAIYLLHSFVAVLIGKMRVPLALDGNVWLGINFVAVVLTTLFFAEIVYRYVEKPTSALKRFFPYVDGKSRETIHEPLPDRDAPAIHEAKAS